jgi:5-hydroxyisourate hydrolase-like protein (transthyretin family)
LINFSYVFSTGPFLDTLYVAGKVMNAAEQKPEKDVKVMLYREEGDSLPYQSLPLFFGVTNDNGEFRVNNISEGEYKLFALKETNNNYLYDNADESIAFLPATVHAGEISLGLQLFHEVAESAAAADLQRRARQGSAGHEPCRFGDDL